MDRHRLIETLVSIWLKGEVHPTKMELWKIITKKQRSLRSSDPTAPSPPHSFYRIAYWPTSTRWRIESLVFPKILILFFSNKKIQTTNTYNFPHSLWLLILQVNVTAPILIPDDKKEFSIIVQSIFTHDYRFFEGELNVTATLTSKDGKRSVGYRILCRVVHESSNDNICTLIPRSNGFQRI